MLRATISSLFFAAFPMRDMACVSIMDGAPASWLEGEEVEILQGAEAEQVALVETARPGHIGMVVRVVPIAAHLPQQLPDQLASGTPCALPAAPAPPPARPHHHTEPHDLTVLQLMHMVKAAATAVPCPTTTLTVSLRQSEQRN